MLYTLGSFHPPCCLSLQLSSELQQHPELLNGTDSELMQGLMEGNYSLPNTSTLLEQLDTIDNAACGWTRFMSKVSIREVNSLSFQYPHGTLL